jgi:integrase
MTGKNTKRRAVARATISKKRVDALQKGESLVDDQVRGFVVRRLVTGSISYGLRYSSGGKQAWLSLGLHGRLTPSQARELAQQRAGEVAAGHDPVAEQEAKKLAAIEQVTTLGSVVPVYLDDRKGKLRASTLIEHTRYLLRYWEPLHEMPIGDIQRNHVVAIVDKIVKEHGHVAADRARTSLSSFYSWAIDRSYCDDTPVRNIKKRNENGPRSRNLSESELVDVWQACGDDDYGRIIKLLILTGQRKSEIGNLDWREIDISKRKIELPPSRTKNGLPHIVPLSDESLAILRGVPRRNDRDLVFGRGAGGFNGWRSKAELNKRLPKKMPGWTVHDIRRSVVTLLVESRERTKPDGKKESYSFTLPHVVEALVNHVSGHKAGVAGTYNVATYWTERRLALDLWGAHVAALIAGGKSKVIPMTAKSA